VLDLIAHTPLTVPPNDEGAFHCDTVYEVMRHMLLAIERTPALRLRSGHIIFGALLVFGCLRFRDYSV